MIGQYSVRHDLIGVSFRFSRADYAFEMFGIDIDRCYGVRCGRIEVTTEE